jgi:DNA-directed RNA polymerase specialized sigma24 family protein
MTDPQRKNRNIEIEVIQEFSQGSETAAQQIYDHFAPAIYWIAAETPLMAAALIPEIVEQVFIRLWTEKTTIKSNTVEHFKSYLFSILKSVILEHVGELYHSQVAWVSGMKPTKKRWKVRECEFCDQWEEVRDKILSPISLGEIWWIQQSSLGNQDAYKKVCDHFHSFGYRLARKHLDSASKIMIENIVKEAFSNLWSDMSKLDLVKWPLKFEFYLERYVRAAALKTMN